MKWKTTYTITYKKNKEDQNALRTDKVTEISALATDQDLQISEEGYEFAGWYCTDSAENEQKVTKDNITTYMTNNAITLYAKWKYTVTYDVDGGTAINPETIYKGDDVSKNQLPIAEKSEETFDKWYIESKDSNDNASPRRNCP